MFVTKLAAGLHTWNLEGVWNYLNQYQTAKSSVTDPLRNTVRMKMPNVHQPAKLSRISNRRMSHGNTKIEQRNTSSGHILVVTAHTEVRLCRWDQPVSMLFPRSYQPILYMKRCGDVLWRTRHRKHGSTSLGKAPVIIPNRMHADCYRTVVRDEAP
jgi:hypothetical protein